LHTEELRGMAETERPPISRFCMSQRSKKLTFNGEKTMSTTTEHVKKIRPLLNFNKLADNDLLKRLHAIRDGLNGNSAFPPPPIDMPTFKAAIDLYDTLTTDALDGGKRVT